MFIKFLDHDLRYGIGRAKKRLIVTFIMFFFLSIYHFWTLRIFELTDPQYLESPVTTADYFLALIGGCGKVNLISGAENDFVMPTMWFVFVLWMQFTSLYYPFAELNGIGKQLMVLSGSRGNWWLSKMCLDNHQYHYKLFDRFCSQHDCRIMLWCKAEYAGKLVCFERALHESRRPNEQHHLEYLVGIFNDRLHHDRTRIGAVDLISYFETGAKLLRTCRLFIRRRLYSKPGVFGNYAMGARNALLVSTGLTMPFGILLGIWLAVLSIGIGYFVFQYRDILGSDLS